MKISRIRRVGAFLFGFGIPFIIGSFIIEDHGHSAVLSVMGFVAIFVGLILLAIYEVVNLRKVKR